MTPNPTCPPAERADEPGAPDPHPAVTVAAALGRRLAPYLIESTVIPTVLFYVVAAMMNTGWALAAGLAWSYVAVIRRAVNSRRVPALLLLGGLGITVRTILYLGTGSTLIYFSQEILRTFATAALFGVSMAVGRPLVARFALDFCSLDPEVQGRPAVTRLFERLTYLWAGVNLSAAIVQLGLLRSLSTEAYVGTSTVAAWVLTAAGAGITMAYAWRTARTEGLRVAVDPDGTLWAQPAPDGRRSDAPVAA